MKRILNKYYEQPDAHKFDNLDDIEVKDHRVGERDDLYSFVLL
jgi:hypothetical protein